MGTEEIKIDYEKLGKEDFLNRRPFKPPMSPEEHPDYEVDLSETEIYQMESDRNLYISNYKSELEKKSPLFVDGFWHKMSGIYKPPVNPRDHPDRITGGLTVKDMEEMEENFSEYNLGYNYVK